MRPLRLLALDVTGSFPSLVVCCRFGPSALSNVCASSPDGVRTAFRLKRTFSRERVLVAGGPLMGPNISRRQHMSISQTVLAGPPSRVVESQKRYVVWPCGSPNAMTLAGFTR